MTIGSVAAANLYAWHTKMWISTTGNTGSTGSRAAVRQPLLVFPRVPRVPRG